MIVIDTETFLFRQHIHAIGSQQQQRFKYKPNSSISFGRLVSASPTTWNKQQLGKFKVLKIVHNKIQCILSRTSYVYKVHEALQTKIEYLVGNFSYDYRVNHARK